ncbi:MAG TPA: hotdog fold thioesterase [Polyangiaceae bacterium]|nr:hotdog fold thioesterase [Polyangiaceae bacterium]
MDRDALRQMVEDFIPFNRFLGIKVVKLGDGKVHLTLPFRPEFVGDPIRPAMHGGVLSTMADVAGGIAVWSGLAEPRARVATIDLRVDYLRPGRLETIDAAAVVVRKGNRVGVVDVSLFHPDRPDEVVATGKGVYNIVLRKEGQR